MPLSTKQHEQFTALMISDVTISRRQNFVVVSHYDDISTHIETAQFDLILLDFTANCWNAPVPARLRHFRHPWQSELIARIKAPAGINSKAPVIAVINPEDEFHCDLEYPMTFYDCLAGPITEQRVDEIIKLWQTKALASDYVQILLNKTQNNQRLALTLFKKLFEELPSQILGINDALEHKQYDLAREITHKLNGSSAFCGLTDIQRSANAFESCLLNHELTDAYQHFLLLHQCTSSFMRHQNFILTTLGKTTDHKKSP